MENILIKDIIARQILDSRGTPTIEVDVILSNNIIGRASVPSGASTGSYEAIELRDNNKDIYFGKSVTLAVKNVNSIIKKYLLGKNPFNQKEIDNLLIKLDGTKNKRKLGANSILGVSLAVAKACANCKNIPLYNFLSNGKGNLLPLPMMNVLNGGKHASSNLSIQEFMIIPVSCTSFSEALRMCDEVYFSLKTILKSLKQSVAVGDEGGFAPNLEDDEHALKLLMNAIENCGYKPKIDFKFALDVAATEMLEEAKKIGKEGFYYFWKTNKLFTPKELIEYYKYLVSKYPIFSIEDALAEEDWENWQILNKELGSKIQLVGDDLFVTNKQRLKKGIKLKACNAILIKPNQIGSLTETLQTIELAQKNGFKTIISHRSGETEDTTITHLAVAVNAGQIKTGAPCRTDRVCKYNELIRIEESLGKISRFNDKL